ncbi:uncharacterized protein LOC143023980 [Oratosquilla oratoria]|uniref:uncharacterized protein LOC143023980 n=1 Tax=Oratosquilla oratoria TaxID=337810 RepID=UPI003F770D19
MVTNCSTIKSGNGSRKKYTLEIGDFNVKVGKKIGDETGIRKFGVGEINDGGEMLVNFAVTIECFVQVYAPQQGRPVDEREIFYEDLQNVKNDLPYYDDVIIMGDLNGHIGQERIGLEHVIGAHSIGKKNLAGEWLLDFCVLNNMSTESRTGYTRTEDLDEDWKAFHSIVTKIGEEVVQCKTLYGKKKKQTPWWTEKVKEAIKIKMRKFRKWMRTRQMDDRLEYIKAIKEAERVKNQGKDKTWDKIGKDLAQDLLGTRKLIYKLAKNYRKKSAPPSYAVKDENGEELLTDAEKNDSRWKNYFENLLNIPNNVEQNEPEFNVEELLESDEDPITVEEIKSSLIRMKNGKAVGEDMIPSEI